MIKTLHTLLELGDLATSSKTQEVIRANQIQLLNSQVSWYVLLMESFIATCVFAALWGATSHIVMTTWLIYMYLLPGLFRLWCSHHYLRNQTSYSNNRSIMLFAMGAFFSGIGWGSCVFLMPSGSLEYQNFIVFLMLGVTAVATNIYSPVLAIYIIYLILAFTPLPVLFYLHGGIYSLIGFMCICYVVVLIGSAYYTNKLIKSCLILEFKNTDLALAEKRLNEELIIASRYAGMADIATSVLHNVGNVLTSANTSVSMMSHKINASKLSNIEKIAELIQEHQEDLASFLTHDPKGQRVPNYLVTLSKSWIEDKAYLLNEVHSLESNIQHIKEVISKQNTLGMSLGFTLKVNLPELIEDALKLNQLSCHQAQIELIKTFEPLNQDVLIDRVKLLQILVNLIKNAVESLIESKHPQKTLQLNLYQLNNALFKIEVKDNGLGIASEHLPNLFHQGFTTKSTGHGFGLHSSSFAAQEMGGTLAAHSDGKGQGATFTLILPFHPDARGILNDSETANSSYGQAVVNEPI